MKNNLKIVALAGLLVAPFLAFGQGVGNQVLPPSTQGPIQSGEGFIDLFRQVLVWIATAFWIAAAVFIFIAAFKYLTAAGDPEKVKTASHTLLYAVIAIVIGLFAYGLPALVNAILLKQ